MTEKFCVQVPKVYDWVTKEAEFHTCSSLAECYTITDQICNNFSLECSSDTTSLWVANSDNIHVQEQSLFPWMKDVERSLPYLLTVTWPFQLEKEKREYKPLNPYVH